MYQESRISAIEPVIEQPVGWHASLDLAFDNRRSRTRMVKCAHQGPLHVQKPFYFPDCNECHVYILHPPGGFVGNDRLEISGSVLDGARTLLTTPAAGKFYKVLPGAIQKQRVCWTLQSGASLAWLPQESIFFSGCDAHLKTEFSVTADSHLFYWDIGVLGRQASGEQFTKGRIRQDFTLVCGGNIQLKERFLLGITMDRDGKVDPGVDKRWDEAQIRTRPWALGGAIVFGTAILTGPGYRPLFAAIQQLVEEWNSDGVSAGVTLKNDLIIIRYLGPKVSLCKRRFEQLKNLLKNEAPIAWKHPRIWNT